MACLQMTYRDLRSIDVRSNEQCLAAATTCYFEARALSQKSPISSVLCKEPKRSLFPASYLLWPNETFSPLTRYVRSRPPPARRTRMGDSYVDRKPPYFSSFSLPPSPLPLLEVARGAFHERIRRMEPLKEAVLGFCERTFQY